MKEICRQMEEARARCVHRQRDSGVSLSSGAVGRTKKGYHMTTPKSHRYLGHNIYPCSYVESAQAGYRWYVESIHSPTGIPYGEQDCKRVRSLAAAREYIREYIRECARYADL